jgi:DNA-binding transcriptional ArsR family regulator
MEQTKHYHVLYLRAINNTVRRRILRAMKDGENTVEDITSATGLDVKTLEWHLNILEHGFCIEKKLKDGKAVFKITQEGKVVEYME